MTIVADPISNLSPETVRLLEFLVYLESGAVLLYGAREVEPYRDVFPIARVRKLIYSHASFGWGLTVYGRGMLKDFRLRGVI